MLQIELMQFTGYFLIWLGIFLHYKAQVRELNELLEKQENKKNRQELRKWRTQLSKSRTW
jgi:hypothetical protein